MTISATVVLDSISPAGIRLTTLHLVYPRFIHAEVLTHRAFSRNSRSSRAVPTKRLATDERVYPLFFGGNQPGMQSTAALPPEAAAACRQVWDRIADACQSGVEELADLGLHKQWANRALEWFGLIHTLVSATDWANFFALRDHHDAQPEIQVLARAIKAAMNASTPELLAPDEWHLPYVTKDDWDLVEKECFGDNYDPRDHLDLMRKLSVARCARVSYKPFDGSDSLEAEFARADRILNSRPLHASPCEHQAAPDTWDYCAEGWVHQKQQGNFRGWIQYRKTLPNECVED